MQYTKKISSVRKASWAMLDSRLCQNIYRQKFNDFPNFSNSDRIIHILGICCSLSPYSSYITLLPLLRNSIIPGCLKNLVENPQRNFKLPGTDYIVMSRDMDYADKKNVCHAGNLELRPVLHNPELFFCKLLSVPFIN